MKYLPTNWKTTLAGSAAAITALGHLLSALSTGDTSTLLPDLMAIVTGAGLIFAKDAVNTGIAGPKQ